MNNQKAKQKTGFFTVIGETNVGKSTLVNCIIGHKVSIVTHKIQTTKSKVLGVMTTGDHQMIIIDTPGLFNSKNAKGSKILSDTWNEIYEAENIIFMIDVSKRNHDSQKELLKKLANKKIILVFNKIDKMPKEILITLAKEFSEEFHLNDIFMISALKNKGVDDLKKFMLSLCLDEEWCFDKDDVTDTPFALFVSEITREKIYEYVHKEIPYFCDVETMRVNGGKIYQTIFVSKQTHKAILIGKNGSKIKEIGTASRIEISRIFGKKFDLFLEVEMMVKQ